MHCPTPLHAACCACADDGPPTSPWLHTASHWLHGAQPVDPVPLQRQLPSRPALCTVLLLTSPCLPLQVTPLPAIPVYYAYYRTFSHYKALAGCDAIRRALAHQDAEQLQVRTPSSSTCLTLFLARLLCSGWPEGV